MWYVLSCGEKVRLNMAKILKEWSVRKRGVIVIDDFLTRLDEPTQRTVAINMGKLIRTDPEMKVNIDHCKSRKSNKKNVFCS